MLKIVGAKIVGQSIQDGGSEHSDQSLELRRETLVSVMLPSIRLQLPFSALLLDKGKRIPQKLMHIAIRKIQDLRGCENLHSFKHFWMKRLIDKIDEQLIWFDKGEKVDS